MIGNRQRDEPGVEVFLGTTLLAVPVAAMMCGASLAGFDLIAAASGGTLALNCLRRVAQGPDGSSQARAVALAMLASLFLLALAATLVPPAAPLNESPEGITAY